MEADPVARLLGVPHGKCVSEAGPITAGPNQLEFFFTGIGPKQARERAAEILSDSPQRPTAGDHNSEKPDAVIVIGLCGGLTDSLPEMTIVTYSSCVSETSGGIPCSCAPRDFRASHSALEYSKCALQVGGRYHFPAHCSFEK